MSKEIRRLSSGMQVKTYDRIVNSLIAVVFATAFAFDYIPDGQHWIPGSLAVLATVGMIYMGFRWGEWGAPRKEAKQCRCTQ